MTRKRTKSRERVVDHRKWHSCLATGKRAYPTRKDARRRAKAAHPDDPALAAYQCPHEPHWHIGHVDVRARDFYRREAS